MLHTSNILVVTHDLDLAQSTQNALSRLGCRSITQASSAEETFAILGGTQSLPDIALIDLDLVGTIDGVDLAQRMQSLQPTPFIYLANSPQDLQSYRIVQSGPHGYLLKQCADDELLATLTLSLESLSERSRQNRQLETQQPLITPVSPTEAVLATDLAGRITYLNTLAEDLTGWTLADVVKRPYQEVFTLVNDQGQQYHHVISGANRDENTWNPAILATRNGTLMAIQERSTSIIDNHGSLAGLVVIFQTAQPSEDAVSPQLSATPRYSDAQTPEDQLSLGRMMAIVDGIAQPLFTMDEAWRVTFMNDHAEDYLGRTKDELLGQIFWEEFADSVHSKQYSEYYMAATRQQPRDFEFYDESKASWMEAHAYPFAEGLLVFLRDVTQRKRSIEQASKLEKLEGLSLLARGFAHDFNNLLTVLLGNVSLASMQSPEEQSYRESLNAAKQATIQAQNLVQQLLTFAKGGVPITEKLNLNEVIRIHCEQRVRLPHIRYQTNLFPEQLMAEIDRGQVVRLLDNLMQNAEHAMPADGTLEVSVRLHPTTTAIDPIAPLTNLDPHTQYLLIEVRDSGTGIPESNLGKIFEPYYSTRSDANATGLGLTVCESIARAHNGFLFVESESGSHTAFRFLLPALQQSWQIEDSAPVAPHLVETEGRRLNDPPRILILDDEKSIRILLNISLKKVGYEVVETAEGSETVEAYKQSITEGKTFDLVIMDLSIPDGMGGAEAIQQIHHSDPNVMAVVSSGYSDDPVMANYASYGFSAVLPKPYTPTEMCELVANLFSGKALSF